MTEASPSRTHITTNFVYSPSRLTTTNTLKRRYSSSQEEEEEAPSGSLSRSSTFASDIQTEGNKSTRWTTAHWKKLEDWYVRKNRDFRKAANSFYYFESLINIELRNDQDNTDGAPITKELWTLDHILWRSQCLDTSVKFHHGVLPSERKKKDKKRKLNNGSSSSSSSSSTTSNSSTTLPESSTGNSNTGSSTSFKRPVTPAARVASSRPTTPSRVTTALSSRTTTPVRATSTSTTPVRRILSYTSSSSSFDERA